MRNRLPYIFVTLGLLIGGAVATVIETDPPILGWLFAIGGGLAGGAFLAAIASGDGLAGGAPGSGAQRGSPGRPAWFDEDDGEQTNDDAAGGPSSAPRNGTH
jgi:hypothetical protein